MNKSKREACKLCLEYIKMLKEKSKLIQRLQSEILLLRQTKLDFGNN